MAAITAAQGRYCYRAVAIMAFAGALATLVKDRPVEPGRDSGSMVGRCSKAKSSRSPIVEADPDYTGGAGQGSATFRTMLGVPMLREGIPIGVIDADAKRGTAIHRKADRTGRDLRRPGGDRHRERAAVRRNPGQEPPARGSEQAQVAVPRQYEPRAAHAAERHPRLYRTDHRQHLRRAAGKNARRARRACRATASTCSA